MALSYSLILSGNTPPREVVSRAFPETEPRPAFDESGPTWIASLRPDRGFQLSIHPGSRGYFEAASGADRWTWEPESYVNVGFRLDKDSPREQALSNMLAIVARLLQTGPEDAAFIFNGDSLLLRRENGQIRLLPAGGFWTRFQPGEIPDYLRPLSGKPTPSATRAP